jgi:hypothetical protein
VNQEEFLISSSNKLVTKNFTFKEVLFSDYALRHNILNVPADIEILNNISYTAQTILQNCRDYFNIPFSPLSFYRCPELNNKIGGSPRSQHMKGEAVDFRIPSIDNLELFRYIIDNLEYDQLILEFYNKDIPNSGWIHCSAKDDKFTNRGENLVTSRNGRSVVTARYDD